MTERENDRDRLRPPDNPSNNIKMLKAVLEDVLKMVSVTESLYVRWFGRTQSRPGPRSNVFKLCMEDGLDDFVSVVVSQTFNLDKNWY